MISPAPEEDSVDVGYGRRPSSGEASAVKDAVEDAGPGFASHGVDDPESGRPPSYVEAAAGAVKDYVKDEVKGKAEGLFASISADDLVDTPGSTQVLAQIFIFFAQKLSLQAHVKVRWPEWYLRLLAGLAFLQLDIGGLPVPSACVTTAQLLVAPALIVRYVYVNSQDPQQKISEPPRYSTTSETLRTIALGIAAPALLSALAIGIGVPTGAGWLTGLGIALCWPVIGYVIVAHVLRAQLWKSCKSKYCFFSRTRISSAECQRVRIVQQVWPNNKGEVK